MYGELNPIGDVVVDVNKEAKCPFSAFRREVLDNLGKTIPCDQDSITSALSILREHDPLIDKKERYKLHGHLSRLAVDIAVHRLDAIHSLGAESPTPVDEIGTGGYWHIGSFPTLSILEFGNRAEHQLGVKLEEQIYSLFDGHELTIAQHRTLKAETRNSSTALLEGFRLIVAMSFTVQMKHREEYNNEISPHEFRSSLETNEPVIRNLSQMNVLPAVYMDTLVAFGVCPFIGLPCEKGQPIQVTIHPDVSRFLELMSAATYNTNLKCLHDRPLNSMVKKILQSCGLSTQEDMVNEISMHVRTFGDNNHLRETFGCPANLARVMGTFYSASTNLLSRYYDSAHPDLFETAMM